MKKEHEQEDRKYLTGLNGKDLVGKRILTERYDSYMKRYSAESYSVLETDKSGTRINVSPDTGANFLNWRLVEDMKIIEVLEDNKAVNQKIADMREISLRKSMFPF